LKGHSSQARSCQVVEKESQPVWVIQNAMSSVEIRANVHAAALNQRVTNDVGTTPSVVTSTGAPVPVSQARLHAQSNAMSLQATQCNRFSGHTREPKA